MKGIWGKVNSIHVSVSVCEREEIKEANRCTAEAINDMIINDHADCTQIHTVSHFL